jgi:anti-sigma factor RsiW
MNVTREVILDLLPLYLTDEASADTRALVKAYLEQDSDLARLAERWQEKLPGPPPPPLSLEAQAQAYREAQHRIAIRTIGLAMVITTGVLGLIALGGALYLFL